MSFNCPDCKGKLRCYDTRPLSDITTAKKYFCRQCELSYPSFEMLDTDGAPKRKYKKSGRYSKKEDKQ